MADDPDETPNPGEEERAAQPTSLVEREVPMGAVDDYNAYIEALGVPLGEFRRF